METMLRHWRLLTINSAKARYIQEAAGAIHGFQLEQKRLRESEYQMAEAERQFESKLKAEREIIDTVKTAWRDRAPNLFSQMNEHFKRDKTEIKSPQTCSPFFSLEETEVDTWHKISKAGNKKSAQI